MNSSLKLLGLVLLTCIAGSVTAQPVDRNAVIQDALKHGAHVVHCQNNKCQDQTTMKYVDHADNTPDGVYLMYPDTPDAASNINRTRDAAKSIGQ